MRIRPKCPILLGRQALVIGDSRQAILPICPAGLAAQTTQGYYHMKKIIILGLTTAVIALASFTASAGSDAQYPAANFQPKVVYIDKEAVKSSPKCPDQKPAEKATEFDPKYPAANFTPKVIYP